MEKRSRLGRGLSSLLSSVAEPVSDPATFTPLVSVKLPQPVDTDKHELFHVELSRVTPNPHQPRRNFDDASLVELAESLKTAGLIQPIIVRAVGDRFELVAGERRWRAAKIAGLQTIPAILRSVDALQQAELALIENIHRENLNPIDRATAYHTLLNQLGLTQEELAKKLSEDRSGIANHLRLLELSESVRTLVAGGKISLGHAKLLVGVKEEAEQIRLADLAVVQQLSVRSLERLIHDSRLSKPPAIKSKATPHIADLERRISRDLQMRSEVRQAAKGKGRLVIHYASLNQFDDLLERLGVKVDD